MGQTLDSFCKGIEFTQSHRPEEAIPHSYDKCEPGLRKANGMALIHTCLTFIRLNLSAP